MTAANDTVEPGIEVTARDLVTGEVSTATIHNDYVLVVAGSCYLDGIQDYPMKGTRVLTVMTTPNDTSGRSKSSLARSLRPPWCPLCGCDVDGHRQRAGEGGQPL
jgi:hypothetical protein